MSGQDERGETPSRLAPWRMALDALRTRRGQVTAAVGIIVAVTAGIGTAAMTSSAPARTTPAPRASASSPISPPPATSAAPSPPSEQAGISIAAVGDIIMGSTPKLPPNGARTFFNDVAPQLQGDIAMGNFEGALTDLDSSPKCRPPAAPSPGTVPTPTASAAPVQCYAFRMPPAYAQVIADAGFDVVNLANNHTRDYGPQGLADTRAAFTAAGVQHTGAPGQITTLTVRGVRVAVLGFAPYAWAQSVVDVPAAAALVRKAAAAADVVVVNMHAGAEGEDRTHVRPGTEMFLGENRGDPMRFSRAVIDAGADLVVGHSPHVMRGMEWYKGRLIAYSMGNFAGYRTLSSEGLKGVGGILRVTLRRDGTWVGGSLVASRMVNGGLPALDPSKRALSLVNDLSAQDFGATAARIAPSGEIAGPITG